MKPPPDTITRPGRIPRLYLDEEIIGHDLCITSKQAHYLRQVLRLKPGHAVTIFDGRGHECLASITKLSRDGAELRVMSTTAPIPESGLRVSLLQAIAKSEAMDLIVQKATELGVHEITPVITEFCVVKLDEERAERRLEHWRRVAQSACEQSGRHTPTLIEAPQPLAACLAGLPPAGTRLALDPYAESVYRGGRAQGDATAPLHLLIGPEGGLSERDLHLAARAGFTRARLGPRILRVETASMAACAIAQAYWGDLG